MAEMIDLVYDIKLYSIKILNMYTNIKESINIIRMKIKDKNYTNLTAREKNKMYEIEISLNCISKRLDTMEHKISKLKDKAMKTSKN